MNPYWMLWRLVMRVAHRFHWCHMKPMPQIEPDWQRFWCQWCGHRSSRYVGPPAIRRAVSGEHHDPHL